MVRTLILEVTDRCNLDCLYCYNLHKNPLPAVMEIVQGKAVSGSRMLGILFRNGVRHLVLTGGEPLLENRHLDLMIKARRRGMGVSLITNGTSRTLDELLLVDRLGLSVIEFPYHSAEAVLHDRMTAVTGSWDKVNAIAENRGRFTSPLIPVLVLTRINAAGAPDTIRRLHTLGFGQVMLNRFNIGGAGISHAGELSLDKGELRALFSACHKAVAETGIRATSNVCSPWCVLDPADYPKIRFSQCFENPEHAPLTVNLRGDVRPCNHSPTVIGNILTDRLEEIVRSPVLQGWSGTVPEPCRGCDLYKRCRGGCRAAGEQAGVGICGGDPVISP
jgi:radical SAM protein with 4Fe4S-binding SPASM domain